MIDSNFSDRYTIANHLPAAIINTSWNDHMFGLANKNSAIWYRQPSRAQGTLDLNSKVSQLLIKRTRPCPSFLTSLQSNFLVVSRKYLYKINLLLTNKHEPQVFEYFAFIWTKSIIKNYNKKVFWKVRNPTNFWSSITFIKVSPAFD